MTSPPPIPNIPARTPARTPTKTSPRLCMPVSFQRVDREIWSSAGAQEVRSSGRTPSAARGDAEFRRQSHDAARHGPVGHARSALDLDDVAKRASVAVEHLLEPRDAVLAELGGDDELLDLARGEGAHGNALGSEEDVVV